MDELIDVLNKDTGLRTGKVILKSQAHTNGDWHGSIHILVVNKDHTKTLLQKRCADKKLFANTWDIAVGGHIGAGEKPYTSAVRELEEELGLNHEDYDMFSLCTIKEELNNGGIVSNEFVNIFMICSNIDINKLTLQEEEVSEARWFSKQEFKDLLASNKMIPHKKDYEILNNILR